MHRAFARMIGLIAEADGPVRNAPAIKVIKNALLENQFTGQQQFLVPVPTSG